MTPEDFQRFLRIAKEEGAAKFEVDGLRVEFNSAVINEYVRLHAAVKVQKPRVPGRPELGTYEETV